MPERQGSLQDSPIALLLIGNALKYSPEGGDVNIRVLSVADVVDLGNNVVQLAVTDHGIAIPAAERENIGGRFRRVSEAVEHGFLGTGIGLSISRLIVAVHRGRIWADGALHGGQGTTMYIRKPPVASQIPGTQSNGAGASG